MFDIFYLDLKLADAKHLAFMAWYIRETHEQHTVTSFQRSKPNAEPDFLYVHSRDVNLWYLSFQCLCKLVKER